MKKYEVTIAYRFDADNEDHAIEQFVDAVLKPENQDASVVVDVESAISTVEEVRVT